jgi:hypothetical protein
MRSHAAHQSRCSHLRGTSGFRGNFGQLGLPGCSATAGCSAVNSGSRNQGPICRPSRVAHGASGAPGTGAQPREPAGHGPAWCTPGLVRARRYRNTTRDQCPAAATAAIRHRVPLNRDPAHPRHRSHHANKPGTRPSPFSFRRCGSGNVDVPQLSAQNGPIWPDAVSCSANHTSGHAAVRVLADEGRKVSRWSGRARQGYWWVKWVGRIELQATPWWWQPRFPVT